MKDLDYGKNYKYAHNFKNAYIYQKYFPDKTSKREYYSPSNFGFEKEIKKRLEWWRKLKNKQNSDSDKKKKNNLNLFPRFLLLRGKT